MAKHGPLPGHAAVADDRDRGVRPPGRRPPGRPRWRARSRRPSSAAGCRCSRATASQSISESGCPGGRCPEITVKSWATPRWVTGIPARAGTAIGLVSPGMTVTGTPAARHAIDLLEAAPEDEAVAALEPDHPLARRARATRSDPVDLLLRRRTARAGSLATSTSSTSAAARRAARAGRAGRRPRRRPPSGPCGRPPRSAPGRRDRRRPAPRRAVRSRWWRATMVPSRSPSRISSRTAALRRGSRPPTPCRARRPSRPRGAPDGRRPGGRRVASSARTQKIRRALGGRAHRLVDGGVVGRGDDVPGPVEVGVLEAARRCQVISPASASPSTAGVTSGETTMTVRAGPRSAAAPAAAPRGRRPPSPPGVRRAAAPRGTAGGASIRPSSPSPPGGPVRWDQPADYVVPVSLDRPSARTLRPAARPCPPSTSTSDDITDGQPLKDDQVAAAGNTSPQLSWSDAPAGHQELHGHLLRPGRPDAERLLALGAGRPARRRAPRSTPARRRGRPARLGVHVPQRRRREGLHGRRAA